MNNIYGFIFKSTASKKNFHFHKLYSGSLSRSIITYRLLHQSGHFCKTNIKFQIHTYQNRPRPREQNHYHTLPPVRTCITLLTLEMGFNTKENLTVTILYTMILVGSCTCNKTILWAYSPLNMITLVV